MFGFPWTVRVAGWGCLGLVWCTAWAGAGVGSGAAGFVWVWVWFRFVWLLGTGPVFGLALRSVAVVSRWLSLPCACVANAWPGFCTRCTSACSVCSCCAPSAWFGFGLCLAVPLGLVRCLCSALAVTVARLASLSVLLLRFTPFVLPWVCLVSEPFLAPVGFGSAAGVSAAVGVVRFVSVLVRTLCTLHPGSRVHRGVRCVVCVSALDPLRLGLGFCWAPVSLAVPCVGFGCTSAPDLRFALGLRCVSVALRYVTRFVLGVVLAAVCFGLSAPALRLLSLVVALLTL